MPKAAVTSALTRSVTPSARSAMRWKPQGTPISVSPRIVAKNPVINLFISFPPRRECRSEMKDVCAADEKGRAISHQPLIVHSDAGGTNGPERGDRDDRLHRDEAFYPYAVGPRTLRPCRR